MVDPNVHLGECTRSRQGSATDRHTARTMLQTIKKGDRQPKPAPKISHEAGSGTAGPGRDPIACAAVNVPPNVRLPFTSPRLYAPFRKGISLDARFATRHKGQVVSIEQCARRVY